MDIKKCRTCKHFESFFWSCNLYYQEVYLGEGDFDIIPIGIKRITKKECNYEKIGD